MTNNCLELDTKETAATQERNEAESSAKGKVTPERFNEALSQCKVEAECLDNCLWEEIPEREKGARLLAALGFHSKGTRYRDCNSTGIPVDCLACGEKYFSRYRCTLRFCEFCGPLHYSRFMEKYREPITSFIASQPTQSGRTLARLTFTVRAADRMPHPEEPRRLMKLVRRWFKVMIPRGTLWGCIFAIETGHELSVKHPGRRAGGWNLHIHALYYGPFLNHAIGLQMWKTLLGDSGGFRIKQCAGWLKNPDRAVRRALVHHFGYIMKPAAASAERAVALEVLFSGVRRVHALGCFYRLPKPHHETANARCPKCGQGLPLNLRAWHKSERSPVTGLEAEGRRDFRKLEAEIRRARVFRGSSP